MFKFPPKTKAILKNETIEYVCSGTSAPAVVFINGSGGPIEGWHKVFDTVATFSKVFAYNRPGTGGSSKAAVPQTGSHMVDSLRTVLKTAGLAPPYVLVGHSLGGLIANLYARMHPSEVRAVVMLEATSPQDVAILPKYETRLQRLANSILNFLQPQDPHAETLHVTATVAELQRAPAFPSIPMTVISGGKPAMAWATAPQALAARAQHQKELVSLSPFGKQVIVHSSGHFPQFTEPQLVISTIRDAVELGAAKVAPTQEKHDTQPVQGGH
ncbi:alpha/beta fold hydrolase [Noviherbaspirillum saxi]|uniref:Alpha/beta hydrolase n=1 Tax=Noviherbaspirillum saxi TaxID=2320863 RepID=A0A3A3G6Y8_9BURK|nr:alpha/beta hydrolase [Noviherbaspirillum saxi]RJF97905.1 alpha/beta hydrolase [Noviherbaspirillum saxi]